METITRDGDGGLRLLKLSRHRGFFKDAIMNMLAFAIYIAAQQIVLLPLLARKLDSTTYANIIIVLSIMNVFCNVLGGQLGVTRQLRKSNYPNMDDSSDYSILMACAMFLICIGMPIVMLALKSDKAAILFFTLTALMSSFRLYSRFFFRTNNRFDAIIIQNVIYCIGIILGIMLLDYLPYSWLSLFLGELLAVIYIIFNMPKERKQFLKTSEFSDTLKVYVSLGAADTLTNAVTLVDKLLMYPLLGAYSLAVYNAGSVTSKVTAMVMTPLNEVILVRLSKSKDKNGIQIIEKFIIINIIIIAITAILMIPVIYVLSFILYRQYMQQIISIIIWLSLACAVGTATSFMKSFVLKYARPRQLTMCYLSNLFMIASLCSLGAYYYGLAGFAIAIILARIQLWASFLFLLWHTGKIKY